MALSYETYFVVFEHCTEWSDTVRQNQSTITTYGVSEQKLREALAILHPSYRNIVILEMTKRG